MVTSALLNPQINAIAGQLSKMQADIAQLQRNQRTNANIQNTTIENGGSITINDSDGNPALSIGGQSDGTITTKVLGTVVAPKQPSTPIVNAGIQGLIVAWDGLMTDGTTPLSDFAYMEVHCSASATFTPSAATLQGHLIGAGLFGVGGLTPGTSYYVILVAVSEAGQSGPPSVQVSGVPASVPSGIPAGSLSGLVIQTGTITAAQIAAAANILGSQLAPGTITSANILAGTITAALLAAGIVVAGIVDATTVTGATLQNRTTDPKTSINPDGSISITSASGSLVFDIGPDGTIDWYDISGALLMEIQPGGTQLIYASLTGPAGWNFEPAGVPGVAGTLTSAASSTTYTMAVTATITAGNSVQVFCTSSGTTAATQVTDSKGNAYVLGQSNTTGQELQVFRCDNTVNPLTTSDTWTITYAAANTQTKTIIAATETGLADSSAQDFGVTASGTSTTPSATATPASTKDLVLFAIATPTAPTAVADGFTLLSTLNVAGGTFLSVYYSSTASAASVSASATITSGAWGAVLTGLKPLAPSPAVNQSWAGTSATISISSIWAGDGSLSLRAVHTGTTQPWGVLSPGFSVQAGSLVTMQCQVYAPAALAGVSIGFNFLDPGNSILATASGDQGTIAMTAGEVIQLTITGASVPQGAVTAQFFVTDSDTTSGLAMHVDVVQVPGGLVYSNSPSPGIDPLGNPFDQGINFIGLPQLTNVFGVEDPYGAQLLSIDASGNISAQTISAADVLVGGQSIVNTQLPTYPQGIIQRGYIPSVSMPYPATAVTNTETAIFEVDAQLLAGRSYMIVLESMRFTMSTTGNGVVRVRATTDGTQPIVGVGASDTFITVPIIQTATGVGATGQGIRIYQPSVNCTLKMLVALVNSGGGATPAIQIVDQSSSTFASGAGALAVFDMGSPSVPNSWIPRAGGTGTSGGTITTTSYADNTWSYSSAGVIRNTGGDMYQGQAQYNPGGWGSQYSIMDFGAMFISNIPAGATINSATLRLHNKHTWYNSGAYAYLHSATSSNPASFSSPYNTVAFGEGQTLSVNVTTMVAAMVAGGTTFRYIALRVPSAGTALTGYGYWSGKNDFGWLSPFLSVTYTF